MTTLKQKVINAGSNFIHMTNSITQLRIENKELKNKLSKCITEKSIARGSNILLKNRKNKK